MGNSVSFLGRHGNKRVICKALSCPVVYIVYKVSLRKLNVGDIWRALKIHKNTLHNHTKIIWFILKKWDRVMAWVLRIAHDIQNIVFERYAQFCEKGRHQHTQLKIMLYTLKDYTNTFISIHRQTKLYIILTKESKSIFMCIRGLYKWLCILEHILILCNSHNRMHRTSPQHPERFILVL